jgi:regulator of protease activity HflC (stomatin/prohibitin superfamily)
MQYRERKGQRGNKRNIFIMSTTPSLTEEDALGAGYVVLIVFLAVCLIIGLIMYKLIIIVHQAEGVVIERLGKFKSVLEPGIHCLTCCDSPRSFVWTRTYINTNKRVVSERVNIMRIEQRESLFNFPPWQVFTRDTVNLTVNMLMYYRIFSVKKAVYRVDDLHGSISNVAQAEIKVIFGSMSFTEALTSQDEVNRLAMEKLNKDFHEWGVHCTRLEILNITPPNDITARLRQQMLAERDRRAKFVIAEGDKAAVRLRSEGTKIVKFQMGVAEQEAKRKRSEGKATATVKLAEAESAALRKVQQALTDDGCTQTEYKISQRYLKMISSAVEVVQQKTIYLPYAAKDLMGKVVGNLPNVFGRKARDVANADGLRQRRSGGNGGGTKSDTGGSHKFDDLN